MGPGQLKAGEQVEAVPWSLGPQFPDLPNERTSRLDQKPQPFLPAGVPRA